jgi:hypothetical protein
MFHTHEQDCARRAAQRSSAKGWASCTVYCKDLDAASGRASDGGAVSSWHTDTVVAATDPNQGSERTSWRSQVSKPDRPAQSSLVHHEAELMRRLADLGPVVVASRGHWLRPITSPKGAMLRKGASSDKGPAAIRPATARRAPAVEGPGPVRATASVPVLAALLVQSASVAQRQLPRLDHLDGFSSPSQSPASPAVGKNQHSGGGDERGPFGRMVYVAAAATSTDTDHHDLSAAELLTEIVGLCTPPNSPASSHPERARAHFFAELDCEPYYEPPAKYI